jgi:hypothetical protein
MAFIGLQRVLVFDVIPNLVTRRCGLQRMAGPMLFCNIRLDCQMCVDGQHQTCLIVRYAIKCEEKTEEVIGSQSSGF